MTDTIQNPSKIITKKSESYKNINELFESFDKEYIPTEINWSKPVGKEI